GQITDTAQLTLGAPLRDEDVRQATQNIQHLFEVNGFYEAQISSSMDRSSPAQDILVTFTAKPGKRSKYEMPSIHGDAKLSDDTIARVTGWRIPIIHWWRQVTDVRTHKGVRDLLGKYQKQDRLRARVSLTDLEYDTSRRRVRPNLSVDVGPKVTVK